MDPVTLALGIVYQLLSAYNAQSADVKLKQAEDWQVVFTNLNAWFAALPVPIHLPPITVYIPPKV